MTWVIFDPDEAWYLPRFQKSILGELSLSTSLEIYYDLLGYDKRVEPSLTELGQRGLTPDYVLRETRRSVASANGKTRIYTGVGFDVPGSPPDDRAPSTRRRSMPSPLELTASSCRESEEMKVEHLRAVGRAFRQATRAVAPAPP